MKTAKYEQIAELLRRRIERGDYSNSSLPGAPKLAQELGMSYMTVRQAMRLLVESGDVVQAGNGRLVLPDDPVKSPKLRVAFVHPGANCENKWYRAILGGAKRYGCSYRDIQFLYSDDQAIFDALDGDYDVLFMQIPDISPVLFAKMVRNRDRVVLLFTNLTDHGIRRFDGLTFDAIGILIRLLQERGCRVIDFFDTAPSANSKKGVWLRELKKFGCTGTAHEYPALPPRPSSVHTREELGRLIREGRLERTDALFCGSMPVARGAIRALADHGIRVPEDIAVVSFGNPEEAELNTPSVTIVNTPDLNPLVGQIYEHYLGIRPNPERLNYIYELDDIAPEKILFHGESVAKHYPPDNGRRRNN